MMDPADLASFSDVDLERRIAALDREGASLRSAGRLEDGIRALREASRLGDFRNARLQARLHTRLLCLMDGASVHPD